MHNSKQLINFCLGFGNSHHPPFNPCERRDSIPVACRECNGRWLNVNANAGSRNTTFVSPDVSDPTVQISLWPVVVDVVVMLCINYIANTWPDMDRRIAHNHNIASVVRWRSAGEWKQIELYHKQWRKGEKEKCDKNDAMVGWQRGQTFSSNHIAICTYGAHFFFACRDHHCTAAHVIQ